MLTHPVHVEGEEDLLHVAVGVLAHALQAQDGLQLEQRDEARRRLSHELVVPVVHVLRQDVVQVRAVVPHRCGPTGAPRQRGEERGILLRLKERMETGGDGRREREESSNRTAGADPRTKKKKSD